VQHIYFVLVEDGYTTRNVNMHKCSHL